MRKHAAVQKAWSSDMPTCKHVCGQARDMSYTVSAPRAARTRLDGPRWTRQNTRQNLLCDRTARAPKPSTRQHLLETYALASALRTVRFAGSHDAALENGESVRLLFDLPQLRLRPSPHIPRGFNIPRGSRLVPKTQICKTTKVPNMKTVVVGESYVSPSEANDFRGTPLVCPYVMMHIFAY